MLGIFLSPICPSFNLKLSPICPDFNLALVPPSHMSVIFSLMYIGISLPDCDGVRYRISQIEFILCALPILS